MFLKWNINVSTMFFSQITFFELKNNLTNVTTILTGINWRQEPAFKRPVKSNSHAAAGWTRLRDRSRTLQLLDSLEEAIRARIPLVRRINGSQ
jgi:hypothetical protein